MPDCESTLSDKCSEIKTEVVDSAADLACPDIKGSSFAKYVSAAALLKLLCVMNKLAQKTHPIGDVVPPDEAIGLASTYWVGNMPRDFSLCDINSGKNTMEGSVVSGDSGSGSGGSGSCSAEEWNIKITTPGGDEILVFDDFVQQNAICGEAIATFG